MQFLPEIGLRVYDAHVQPTTYSVRVTPRARRNTVVRDAAGNLKVYVTAPPEDGRANDAVIETFADWLGVKRRQVDIIAGQTSRNKIIRVEGEAPAEPFTSRRKPA